MIFGLTELYKDLIESMTKIDNSLKKMNSSPNSEKLSDIFGAMRDLKLESFISNNASETLKSKLKEIKKEISTRDLPKNIYNFVHFLHDFHINREIPIYDVDFDLDLFIKDFAKNNRLSPEETVNLLSMIDKNNDFTETNVFIPKNTMRVLIDQIDKLKADSNRYFAFNEINRIKPDISYNDFLMELEDYIKNHRNEIWLDDSPKGLLEILSTKEKVKAGILNNGIKEGIFNKEEVINNKIERLEKSLTVNQNKVYAEIAKRYPDHSHTIEMISSVRKIEEVYLLLKDKAGIKRTDITGPEI